ncbi:MAG: GGDEF domain-containing protein [Desulfuromonadaceae bacterium]|nr:GGDEF domain-containing protein [Desulfuromonadaceae bacterium]MDD5107170.1 GGDEF domain-containing protein [Desulfuromonadaceae bacterium]
MNKYRRVSDRRAGQDRRRDPGSQGFRRIPTWDEQRAQHFTRFIFCILALLYFNVGEAPRVSKWFTPPGINAIFVFYGMIISISMITARKKLYSPLRWRVTMWVDMAAASCAVLADVLVLSPGFLVFLMVILGNGMRYGMWMFGEAVIGSFVCAVMVLVFRLPEYINSLSVGAVFSSLFYFIFVLYSYSLMSRIETRKQLLERERNRDELTGLLNRRALFERAALVFEQRGASQSVAVLFADLDGFKAINDTHGHHAGDRVLSEIGEIMSGTVRSYDLVARYGGDEFVMVLSGADAEGGAEVARRLQLKINEWALQNRIDVSVSIGIGHAPAHGNDFKTVIKHVDQAMYQSRIDTGRGGIQMAASAQES